MAMVFAGCRDAHVNDRVKNLIADTLLCDQHHTEKTKELLPQDAVLKANADPHNVRVGVSTPYGLHYSGATCALRLPTCLFEGQKTELVPLLVRDQEIIAFRFVDDNLFLNCHIVRPDGEIGLLIEENELIYKTDSWDVEFVGRTLTIRNGSRNILVKIEFRPPSEVFIERLNLVYSDMRVWGDDHDLHVRGPGLGSIERERDLAGVRASGRVCISLDSKRLFDLDRAGVSYGWWALIRKRSRIFGVGTSGGCCSWWETGPCAAALISFGQKRDAGVLASRYESVHGPGWRWNRSRAACAATPWRRCPRTMKNSLTFHAPSSPSTSHRMSAKPAGWLATVIRYASRPPAMK